MHLHRVSIRNFRSCRDLVVDFGSYSCLVGPNGAGKSTVLQALNLFFRDALPGGDAGQLVEEDFHQRNTAEPVIIQVTFTELSPEAQQDFREYFRGGQLTITAKATFDASTKRAEVVQFGERLVMKQLAPFFELEGNGANVGELKTSYIALREQFPDLPPPGTKAAMVQALRDYEAGRPEHCELLASSDQFYGFSKGTNRLAKYIQWVYVPAVKDASTEQTDQRNTTLSRLLSRTVNAKANFREQVANIRNQAQVQYQQLLDENQTNLNALSETLQNRLTDWAHPEATLKVSWWQDPDKAIAVQEPAATIVAGEDNFAGQLCRLGHVPVQLEMEKAFSQ